MCGEHGTLSTDTVRKLFQPGVIIEAVVDSAGWLGGTQQCEEMVGMISLTARGTASCQLSKLKCMTASVYPHTTQLRLFAVRPSNTVEPTFLCLDEPLVSEIAPRPRSRKPSLSTAVASRLIHSETSWKSSWASWCSREHSSGFVLPSGSIERALINSIGLIALALECGIFSARKG